MGSNEQFVFEGIIDKEVISGLLREQFSKKKQYNWLF